MNQQVEATATLLRFVRRRTTPLVCIADRKRHIRVFLANALQGLGCAICECEEASELPAVLDAQVPDLVVLVFSTSGTIACEMLEMIAASQFGGKVLLLGPGDPRIGLAVREFGQHLGLAMLPTLATPFNSAGLRGSIATLLSPRHSRRSPQKRRAGRSSCDTGLRFA